MIYLVSKAGMHIGESCEHGRALCASYAELECVRRKAVESALALMMPDEAMIVGCQVAAQLRSLKMMLHFLYWCLTSSTSLEI
jgi:hypothetical protein